MDPKIVQRYKDEILNEARKRFDIDADHIHLLDGFESYIYEFSRPDGDYILRIGHSIRRKTEHILGEVDWINYLAEGGAGVSKAIPSAYGQLVEFIDDHQGGFFMATAFIKAPGRHPSKTYWNPRLFQAWGKLLGRIHTLSKDYIPSNSSWKRYEWDSAENVQVAEWLPADDGVVLNKFQELMDYLESLPKDRESYGLIHQDAHAGNLYVDSNYDITLFDFDDCVYSWYIYDIAMVLFYSLMGYETNQEQIGTFSRHFILGYNLENSLDPAWLEEIPFFLKLREIDLYAQINFAFGGFENVEDSWCQNYIQGRKRRIEEDIPYIDYDWTTLTKILLDGK